MNHIKLYKVHNTGKVGWWAGSVGIMPDGRTILVMASAGSKTAEPVRHTDYIEGKNIGRSNETTPFGQACLELLSRAKKKRDKGYVDEKPEAGATATNALNLALPMLATPITKVKPESIDWDNAFIQPKLDGHRALFKDGVLYSRGGQVIDLPHITEALAGCELHLDGELYCHELTLQENSRLIKKYRPGETERIQYHVYDVVSDEEPAERNAAAHYAVMAIGHDPIRMVRATLVASMPNAQVFHKRYLAEGYEGSILRHGTSGYESGKRSKNLLKFKDFDDAEFRVVAVIEGKHRNSGGKPYRQAIFVCTTAEGELFNVAAHGTVPERSRFLDSPESHCHKQLTVQFFGKSKDGIPQLPVALRFREDL